jgi:hypothetical protein
MFRQALFENIQQNFMTNNSFFYGEAPQTTKVPYIVQTSLDYGDTALTQCRNTYTEFAEFRIYGTDFFTITTIQEELINYLASLDYVGDYTILENIKHTSVVGNDVENGLPVATVAREFLYST